MSKTNKALELMYKHHSEYIEMAKAIAGNNFKVKNYAEDYVQEAYIRLARFDNLYDKVISKKKKVSKGYMFFTLRSIIINDLKLVRVPKYTFIGDEYDMEEKYMLEDTGADIDVLLNSAIEDKMREALVNNLPWFDVQLFETYFSENISYKELAERTGIGIQTIYLSIKKSKLTIARELWEDYQDFKNKELNLIT